MDRLYLDFFPTEILTTILLSTSSTSDIMNLAATCRRFHDLFNARKLEFVAHAAEAEYGPLEDAIQLVTHNASQPAHIIRQVPLSFALLKELTRVGRVAKRWEDIYPLKKWKMNFENRRLLNDAERRLLRRALYRLWLYTRAFHNAQHSRYSRLNPMVMNERSLLLHNWSTAELAQIADVRQAMRDVLGSNICPSNGTINRKFRKRFPDTKYQLLFNLHLNHPSTTAQSTPIHYDQFSVHNKAQAEKYHAKYKPTPFHEPGDEGWGDDLSHYYVLEDVLKLDPEQILWLKDNAPSKIYVEAYLKALGEWFENNGETFGQTMNHVLAERGHNAIDFSFSIDQGIVGVAVDSL